MATHQADAAKEVTDRDVISIIHTVRRNKSSVLAGESAAASAAD
jgi:hypothetical protein